MIIVNYTRLLTMHHKLASNYTNYRMLILHLLKFYKICLY